MGILYSIFGFIWRIFYDLVNNYALSLFLFTFVIRLCLFPLSVKQQKSMASQAIIGAKMEALKKKYSKPEDKEKLNNAMLDLYEREHINPSSGCLPLLIQFPVMMGIYGVIYQPLTYLIQAGNEAISAATQVVQDMGVAGYNRRLAETFIVKNFSEVRDLFTPETADKIESMNFNLFGFLDLTESPSISRFDILWLIPITAALMSLLSAYITKVINRRNFGQAAGAAAMGNSMNNSMMIVMPLMSLWWTFSMPAGIGFYWIISSLFGLIQQIVITVFFTPQDINARAELKLKKQRLEHEQKIKNFVKEVEEEIKN